MLLKISDVDAGVKAHPRDKACCHWQWSLVFWRKPFSITENLFKSDCQTWYSSELSGNLTACIEFWTNTVVFWSSWGGIQEAVFVTTSGLLIPSVVSLALVHGEGYDNLLPCSAQQKIFAYSWLGYSLLRVGSFTK